MHWNGIDQLAVCLSNFCAFGPVLFSSSLYLSIGLRIVARSEAHRDLQLLHETRANVNWAPIAHNVFWNAKMAEHMLKHILCSLKVYGKFGHGNELNKLAEAVNDDQDDFVTL